MDSKKSWWHTSNNSLLYGNNPCVGCYEKRSESCHATCVAYKKWKHDVDVKREEIRQKDSERQLIMDYRCKMFAKMARSHKAGVGTQRVSGTM